MATRAEIVAAAREAIGAPWVHQGRTERGFDCGGLLIAGIAHKLGLSDFDVTGYDRLPDGVTLKAICDQQMIPIKIIDKLRPGDVVLMRAHLRPQHLALITDYPYGEGELAILHAAADVGKVCEHRLDARTKSRIVAAYRLPGVAE